MGRIQPRNQHNSKYVPFVMRPSSHCQRAAQCIHAFVQHETLSRFLKPRRDVCEQDHKKRIFKKNLKGFHQNKDSQAHVNTVSVSSYQAHCVSVHQCMCVRGRVCVCMWVTLRALLPSEAFLLGCYCRLLDLLPSQATACCAN